MQASKWTETAALPEVAAAQIDVPSRPVYPEKKPADCLTSAVLSAIAISDALLPYASRSFGVFGSISSNIAPSFRAVTCAKPSSATFFLCVESAVPRP